MRLIFFLFMLFSMLSCATPRITNPSISSIPIEDDVRYTVKSGDTLQSIAKEHAVSAESILQANNFTSWSQIKPNTQIIIPESMPLISASLKFMWPMKGDVVGPFGQHVSHVTNKGLNIHTRTSEQVVASETGKVVFANTLKGWGTIVVLKHINNFYTVYANLKETSFREGLLVKKGDILGKASASNELQGYVLHFEIRKQNTALNPLSYLSYN
jgi:septal ring factor EnvC (AmiA/AmiB activator)